MCWNSIIIFPQKHILWYSLEARHGGTSNEYPQHMFLWRNKKNIMWITLLHVHVSGAAKTSRV